MRESAALLSQAIFFIGPDGCLLMHIANGLDIKSIVIFGLRPVDSFGYKENINLATAPVMQSLLDS